MLNAHTGLMPVVLADIISIYGLVVAALILPSLGNDLTPLSTSLIQFGEGLFVGLSGLAAGFFIGIVGDAGVRKNACDSHLCGGESWGGSLLDPHERGEKGPVARLPSHPQF